MKIDTDLRLAIKSAEKSQPDSNWVIRQKAEKDAINEWFTRKPAAKKLAMNLLNEVDASYKKIEDANLRLRKKLGLRIDNRDKKTFELVSSEIDGDSTYFVKAGGKLPTTPAPKWRYDNIMTKLTKATPKEGAEILKILGINWS